MDGKKEEDPRDLEFPESGESEHDGQTEVEPDQSAEPGRGLKEARIFHSGGKRRLQVFKEEESEKSLKSDKKPGG